MRSILLLLILATVLEISAQTNRWQKLNGPEGGGIAGLICKGDTLVVGSANSVSYKGSIYFSFDGGENWEKSNRKFSKYFIDFAFTDDGGIIGASLNSGLYKSFDFKNWFQVFYNGQEFWSLGKDLNGVLYTGTDNGIIYCSSDNGVHWNFSFQYNTWRIINFLSTKSGRMFAGAINGLYYKDLNNTTWSPINLNNIEGHIQPISDNGINVYFFSYPFFYSSNNEGDNWAAKDVSTFFYGNSMYGLIFNKRIIAAMGDETGWFGNGWGMALSDDTGKTWRWNNTGLPPKFSSADKLVCSGNNTYLGTESAGVFKSTNYGDSWFSINKGLNAADTWVINFDNEDNLYSACWSNGLYKSTDKGLSWSNMNKGFTNSYLMAVASDKNGILLASTKEGTFRSSDKGENWNQIDGNFYYYFFTDNFNRIYGLTYGNGLFRSVDQGSSWTKLDNGFNNEYVFGFAIDSSNNIYTGTSGGAIYKSTDDGLSWANVYQSNNSDSFISYIAVAPNGCIFASNVYEGILRSTDNGQTWNLIKSDNRAQDTYPLGINKKGEIFVSGSNSTFFSSTDNGNTWIDITDNLALTIVRDIKFDKNDTMYIATDESVWRSNPDYSVDIKNEIKPEFNYSLQQNYPNPFNPSTSIKYSLQKAGFVSLDIYDVLGNKIASLVNEQKDSGEYEVQWNASKFSSGVYFYQLKAGDFIQTRKMLLLK